MSLFVVYAVIEVAALVAMVSWLGLGVTMLVLVVSAVVGLWMVRREGARTALAVAEAMRAGRLAHEELTDGALIGVAGLLILVPGLVGDLVGLLLVLPPSRALVRRWLTRRAERRSPLLRTARIRTGGPVVDGQVVDVHMVDARPTSSGPPAPPTSRPAAER